MWCWGVFYLRQCKSCYFVRNYPCVCNGDVLDKEHEDACVPEKRDVSYFRALWATEVEQLTNLADKWEALGEEISGLCEEGNLIIS